MIEHVDPYGPGVQALVLTPTRELCIQVTQALRAYGQPKGVDVVAVFGGAPIRTQQAQLNGRRPDRRRHRRPRARPDPARLADPPRLPLRRARRGRRDARPRLPGGRRADPRLTPSGRQTALFSATMPPPIRKLADRYLYDPVTVKVKAETLTVDSVEQFQVDVKAPEGQGAEARRGARRREARRRRSSSRARRSAPTSSTARCATTG